MGGASLTSASPAPLARLSQAAHPALTSTGLSETPLTPPHEGSQTTRPRAPRGHRAPPPPRDLHAAGEKLEEEAEKNPESRGESAAPRRGQHLPSRSQPRSCWGRFLTLARPLISPRLQPCS